MVATRYVFLAWLVAVAASPAAAQELAGVGLPWRQGREPVADRPWSAGSSNVLRQQGPGLPFRDEPTQVLSRGWRAVRAAMERPIYRLPGEFERQHALLISCHEFVDDMPELLAELVNQLQRQAQVIALVNDVGEYQRARDQLMQRGVPLASVQFAEVPHDTMWCRDYGPILVEGPAGDVVAVDTEYVRGVRPQDDDVPLELCRHLRLPMVLAPLRMEGGNLLSNGRGLCLTTRHVLETNAEQSDEYAVRLALRQCFGAEQTVFLEALMGEPTGHVDMFATFPSANTVVVGQYDPNIDPVNAEILDRNAERLARVRTADGPLRVIRVPMPRRDEEIWRTYTNVVYANGVLLVPVYPNVDEPGCRATLGTYQRLLPGWRVVAVDAARLVELGGAMHCVTMNLGPLKQIPPFPTPSKILSDMTAVAGVFPSVDPAPRGDVLDDLDPGAYRILWQREGVLPSSVLR